jgi:hypothetical protein
MKKYKILPTWWRVGFRIYTIDPKTQRWIDCAKVYGDSDLWITYTDKAKAESVMYSLLDDI